MDEGETRRQRYGHEGMETETQQLAGGNNGYAETEAKHDNNYNNGMNNGMGSLSYRVAATLREFYRPP